MANTPNISLKLMAQSQTDKYIVFNELARKLDVLFSAATIVAIDRDLTSPPGSPVDGVIYLIASSATGDWSGQDGKIAYYNFNAWEFYTPLEGWILYIKDEDITLAFNGTSWVNFPAAIQNISLLGVNTTADTTNKFAVSSSATLFNHIGNGHQQKINKNAEGDSASQLFQVNFSGRAEYGLLGNNNFTVKTSSNGSTFVESLVALTSNGSVSCPQGQYNGTVAVADDNVSTITVPTAMYNSGIFAIHAQDVTGNSPDITQAALVLFDAGTTAAISSIFTGTFTTLNTGVLTGTTGSDTTLNISAHSDGNIYVENRSGDSATYRYLFIG